MLSEFWLDGCCAGSIEFLLPLDSTPAYLTHLAAPAAVDAVGADFAVPACPAIAAIAAIAVIASVSGSRTFSCFFIRLETFREEIAARPSGPGLCEAVCSAPLDEEGVRSCRWLEQFDRVAVGVAEVDGRAAVVDAGVDLDRVRDTAAAGRLGALEHARDVVDAEAGVRGRRRRPPRQAPARGSRPARSAARCRPPRGGW